MTRQTPGNYYVVKHFGPRKFGPGVLLLWVFNLRGEKLTSIVFVYTPQLFACWGAEIQSQPSEYSGSSKTNTLCHDFLGERL